MDHTFFLSQISKYLYNLLLLPLPFLVPKLAFSLTLPAISDGLLFLNWMFPFFLSNTVSFLLVYRFSSFSNCMPATFGGSVLASFTMPAISDSSTFLPL
jgi:hypothetical protein